MSDGIESEELLPITEQDWNFDIVPNGELVACCLWEFARESPSITMASQIAWCQTRGIRHGEAYKRNPTLKAEHDEEARRIERMAKAAKFDGRSFQAHFLENETALIDIFESLTDYVGSGGYPWQKLPVRARKRLVAEASKSLFLRPLPPARVGEMEALWNANRADLDEARSKSRPVDDDSEFAALTTQSQPATLTGETAISPGGVAVGFVVDFTRFTDKEISGAFLDWLKANRPKKWRRPKRVFPGARHKGRKVLEYRVALERLGLMRLLHWFSPKEIRKDAPAAWAKYRRKMKDCRREIREAAKFFRRLFPFLPARERPDSQVRKGIWIRGMMAVCDEVEREMKSR